MCNNDSSGFGGGVRWGGIALGVALGLGSAGCGQANKDKCKESVINAYTGECGGDDGSTSATGATGSGATGATDDGGGTPAGASTGNGGTKDTDEPATVYEWGQKNSEDNLSPGDWLVDNSKGQHQGENAVHPPALQPGEEASMTFDCNGQEHTQLSFVAWRLTGNTELELFDGSASRGIIDGAGGWNPFIFDVPAGKHEYTFTVRNTGTTKIDVPYVLDTFACKSAIAEAGLNGFVDFDDAFVPIELEGGWFVDNLRGQHQGEAAVHPPALEPGEDASMTFDCAGREHTQLSFVAWRLTGNTQMELFDGKTSRGTIDGAGGWNPFVIDVPAGEHEYTFKVTNTGTTRIDIPYVLDTFVCKNVAPTAGANGFVDFDDGFVPVEIAGDWFVDNIHGHHQGEAAVHPPALEAGEEKSMTFDCPADDHTRLSFVVWRLTGATELELLDGSNSRATIDGAGGWNPLMFDGEAKSRQYTFTARNTGTKKIDVPYVLDTFRCE
jgi:hypothetical protein